MGSTIYERLGPKPAKYSMGQALGDAIRGGGAYFGAVAVEKAKAEALLQARAAKLEDREASQQFTTDERLAKQQFELDNTKPAKVNSEIVTVDGVQWLINSDTGENIKELGREESGSTSTVSKMNATQQAAYSRSQAMGEGLDRIFKLLGINEGVDGNLSFNEDDKGNKKGMDFDSLESKAMGLVDGITPEVLARWLKGEDGQEFDAATNLVEEGALRAFTGAAAPEPEKFRIGGMLSVRRGMNPETALRNLKSAIVFQRGLAEMAGQPGFNELSEVEQSELSLQLGRDIYSTRTDLPQGETSAEPDLDEDFLNRVMSPNYVPSK